MMLHVNRVLYDVACIVAQNVAQNVAWVLW